LLGINERGNIIGTHAPCGQKSKSVAQSTKQPRGTLMLRLSKSHFHLPLSPLTIFP